MSNEDPLKFEHLALGALVEDLINLTKKYSKKMTAPQFGYVVIVLISKFLFDIGEDDIISKAVSEAQKRHKRGRPE